MRWPSWWRWCAERRRHPPAPARKPPVHIDPYIVLGSAIVGLLVGMTGAGGGALMTPMLILLFGVSPSTAISSDLVAAVPAAFFGTYVLHLLGHAKSAQHKVEVALGVALLAGAAAMAVRFVIDRRTGQTRRGYVNDVQARPLATVAIGVLGGIIVGITSVGSGSLMIVLLLFVYPMIGAGQLVGTDLTQAVPLTLSAAIGALIFG